MDTITENFTSLYAHFPFCETKCHYCDFFSLPEAQIAPGQRARIYEALLRELELYRASLNNDLETVFLGGGTPSLAPVEFMGEFVSSLRLSPTAEVTIEANPSSITLQKARAWAHAGINRVSMGVQALDDDRLKWLGRVHSKTEVFSALSALFEGGMERVSIDYIVGVPGQASSTIEKELAEVLGAFPHIDHVSAYLLTLKTSNSKFTQLPDEDVQLEHLRTVSRTLANKAFEQYEISNFAKRGSRARHNENYWLGGGYLGIGPSAHSYWPKHLKRTKNWASLGKYAELVESACPPVEWEEVLTNEQLRLEYLMLQLRRSAGVNFEDYSRRFGRDLFSDNRARLEQWTEKGLCLLEPGRLRLTPDGFFLSDQILSHIA